MGNNNNNSSSNDLISFQPQETEVTLQMNSDQLLAYQDRVLEGKQIM